jgi:hypothetical protein
MIKEAVNATADALHRVSTFADADQSQVSRNFKAAADARQKFLDKNQFACKASTNTSNQPALLKSTHTML